MTGEQTRTLVVAALGTVVALVAFTTPVITLDSTAADLGSGPGGQAWILSSMSLGLAVALLPAGALGDDHGRRLVFVVGGLVLAASSVVAALSPTTFVLVAARVGQGLGTAAIIACSLGLIGHAFPAGPARLRATGVWGAALGLGIAIGPLGAAALDATLGWRSALWLVAVLSAVVAVVAWRGLAESRAAEPRPVDLVGMALLGLALAGVLAGLVHGRSGWGDPLVAALLGGGLALGVAYVLVALRTAHPMLDLRLFRRADVTAATVAAFATGAGVIASMSYLPMLLQRGMGHGVVYAAFISLGWSLTSAVTALLARRLPASFSPRWQLAWSLVGTAAGQLVLAGIALDVGTARLLLGMIVAGIASGVLNAALARQAVASMPPGLASVGSGANNTARYVGSAIGVTVVTVIAAHPLPADMAAGWTRAVLLTSAISVLGAVVVLACRSRVGPPIEAPPARPL